MAEYVFNSPPGAVVFSPVVGLLVKNESWKPFKRILHIKHTHTQTRIHTDAYMPTGMTDVDYTGTALEKQ